MDADNNKSPQEQISITIICMVIVLLGTLLTSCTGVVDVFLTPTSILTATNSIIPTSTLTPTQIPTARSTPTSSPTSTVTLTSTPSPTNTVTLTPIPTNTSIPTATETVRPTATAIPIQQLPFLDDFSNPASGLLEESYENAVTYYSTNGYVMDIQATEYLKLSPYAIEFPPDISINADIVHGTSPDAAIGLAFRVENAENFYVFMVDGRANYWIIKVVNSEIDVLYDSYSPLLASELGEIRHIRVDARGNKMQVFANNILLTTLYDDDLPRGTVGLITWTADEPNKAVITELEVLAYEDSAMPSSANCNLLADQHLTSSFSDDLRIEHFGPLGADAIVNITLQSGVVSMLLTAQTKLQDDIVMLESVTSPDGQVLYDLLDIETGEFESNYFHMPVANEGEITLYLPASPEHELLEGNYELVLYTYKGQPICDAMAVIRTGPVDRNQAIDLNLWVASEAPALNTPEQLPMVEAEIRAAVDKILTQHSMQLGRVKFIDASPEQKAEYARSDDSYYAAICQTVADATSSGRAWNMALVDTYSLASDVTREEEDVFGTSSLPGSVFAPGSLYSCGIISWEAHNGNYNELGATIVHEGSHFLGLHHTTEMDGETFDPFTDTPECQLEVYDMDESGDVDDTECENADGDNYMFWMSSSYFDSFVISPDQAWTLRRHPLFYSIDVTE